MEMLGLSLGPAGDRREGLPLPPLDVFPGLQELPWAGTSCALF